MSTTMTPPPAATAAWAMCRAASGAAGCRCEKAGKGLHCAAMESAATAVLAAAGLAPGDIAKVFAGPVRVTRPPARKGGAK